MARSPWPGDGVGRGNGPGSARTQFKSGMPTANPNGRPKRAKQAPNRSLKEAALRSLAGQVLTKENGVARKRTQPEAMMMLLLAEYPSAKLREKVMILKYLGSLAPEIELERNRDLPPTAIEDLVAALAREGLYEG